MLSDAQKISYSLPIVNWIGNVGWNLAMKTAAKPIAEGYLEVPKHDISRVPYFKLTVSNLRGILGEPED
jgi:hypothetical protein